MEVEKAQLLSTLQKSVPALNKALAIGVETDHDKADLDKQDSPQTTALVEPVRESAVAVPDVAGAIAERVGLEAQLDALKKDLEAARLRERQVQQAAADAARSRSQADGKRVLSVLEPKLKKHLAEVVRIQSQYGSVLRDFARSCASDPDGPTRRKVGEINAAAGPVAMKINDARLTIEAALRGLTKAMEHHMGHVHQQAQVLAEAALSINLLSLESEAKSLIELKRDLRGGHLDVGSLTPDRIHGVSEPPSTLTVADLSGPIITN